MASLPNKAKPKASAAVTAEACQENHEQERTNPLSCHREPGSAAAVDGDARTKNGHRQTPGLSFFTALCLATPAFSRSDMGLSDGGSHLHPPAGRAWIDSPDEAYFMQVFVEHVAV